MKKSFKRLTNSWFFKIGLIGLFLRLILMPITAHPDIWSLNSTRYLLVEEQEWNVYDRLASLPADHPISQNYGRNYYTYPPLSYFTFGFFSYLLKAFYQPDISYQVYENYPLIYHLPGIRKHLFLFKFPYLFFDFGIAYFLVQLFKKEKEKKSAFLLWIFNPLSLYSAYMMGQFELMPLFFVVWTLFLAEKKRPELAALSLGLGGAYKMFPLFFLPILAVFLGKSAWEKVKLLILGLMPFLLSIAPFLWSPVFRQIVLFSKQSQKFLHMSLPVSGAEGIFVFVFLWGLIFLHSYYRKAKGNFLWFYFLAIMLAFFSLTHYHPQWFVWLVPLLIIQLVKTEFKFSFLAVLMFISWLLITLFFEPSLNFALFTPLNPRLLDYPSLAEIFGRFYDVFQLKSIIRSLFAAAAAFLVYYNCIKGRSFDPPVPRSGRGPGMRRKKPTPKLREEDSF